MDQLKFLDLRKQMHENNEELGEFLGNINQWKASVEKKSLKMNKQTVDKKIPAVRNSLLSKRRKKVKKANGVKEKTTNSIKGNDYRSWDKFDVDKALQEIDAYKSPESSGESETDDEWEDERRLKLSEDEKDKGNLEFKKCCYNEAIDYYTTAINLAPESAVLYTNRAMALLKLERFASAELDCSVALSLDSSNVKALFRRALCRKALDNKQSAMEDLESLLKTDRDNKPALKEYETLTGHAFVKTAVTTAEVASISGAQKLHRGNRRLRRIPIIEVGRGTVAEKAAACAHAKQPSRGLVNLPVCNEDPLTSGSTTSTGRTVTHVSCDPHVMSPATIAVTLDRVRKSQKETVSGDVRVSPRNISGVSDRVPANWFQMERDLRELAGAAAFGSSGSIAGRPQVGVMTPDMASYLCRLTPENYARVIGQNLDTEALTRLINSFEMATAGGQLTGNDLVSRLSALVALPRFDVASMLLDDADRTTATRLIADLDKTGFIDANTRNALATHFN